MRSCCMDDFMPEHRGKFCFVIEFYQEATVYCDLAAWQGPGIGNTVIEHDKLIIELPVADSSKALSDFTDIRCQSRISFILAALALLGGAVLLGAYLPLLGFRYN